MAATIRPIAFLHCADVGGDLPELVESPARQNIS
jgi:hypothetical protein